MNAGAFGVEPVAVSCPYCGEPFEALVDTSEGDTEYVQDCAICCHPIRFRVRIDPDGLVLLETDREDD